MWFCILNSMDIISMKDMVVYMDDMVRTPADWGDGGSGRTRTVNLLRARQAFSLLNYAPDDLMFLCSISMIDP